MDDVQVKQVKSDKSESSPNWPTRLPNLIIWHVTGMRAANIQLRHYSIRFIRPKCSIATFSYFTERSLQPSI